MKTKIKIIDSECDYLDEDMPEEIDFSDGKPNPYSNIKKVIVELDPDIAKVFKNSKEVNRALRGIISIIPKRDRVSIP